MAGENNNNLTVGSLETRTTAGTQKDTKGIAQVGETCFVIQPFASPHGGYYELIYARAIERTGLTPVRADDSRFGTGMVMEQIRRGIQEARVLVADLSTRNANVMYEVGLAHGMDRQVVLVSNKADGSIPFDVNHLRVAEYTTTDPFWGDALIKRIEECILYALEHPEEPVFHATDSGMGNSSEVFVPHIKTEMMSSSSAQDVRDDDSRYKLVLEDERRSNVHGEYAMIFGPRKKLSSRGRYKVHFSLKHFANADVPPDQPLLRLDVYGRENKQQQYLAKRDLAVRDLPPEQYTSVSLDFRYDEIEPLEYRVLLLAPGGVRVRCDYISVERYGAPKN
jgi:hypothetical protein